MANKLHKPEGIALRPGSNQFFIAFDQGAAIAAFTYTPRCPKATPHCRRPQTA